MPVPYPTHDIDCIKAIQLYRSPRVGPRGFRKLFEIHETIDEALDYCVKRARETGDKAYQLAPLAQAKEEFEKGRKMGAHFIPLGAPQYPKLLEESSDAPPFLWALGDLQLLHRPTLAVIGTRNASLQGVRYTHQLVKLLGYEGVVVVSGLARGIDAAAHEAALTCGTIGVVAGGLDVYYPRQNETLQKLMSEHGLVVSEMPFGHQPTASDFPRRNRIIAGLSMGVLVVEGNLRSGTKLTVNDANALGREVMAVPGHPFSSHSALSNQMIKDGASLVTDAEDVLTLIPALRSNNAETPKESFVERPKVPPPTERGHVADLGRALIDGNAVQMADGQIQRLD